MEHIAEILKKTHPNTSKVNTDVSSRDNPLEEPRGTCSSCQGARVVYARSPDGTVDYSRTLPCRCVKVKADVDRVKRLIEYSQLGALRKLTFENLDPEGRHGSIENREIFKKAYDAGLIFSNDPKGFFVITGISGSGKTHLAAAITNRLIENDHAVLFRSVPDLMDDLRAGFSNNSDSIGEVSIELLKSAPILVLDDLGIQSDTAWSREKIDQLITYRLKQNIPTILIIARPLHLLDDRLRNRISDPRQATLVHLTGLDNSGSLGWPEELSLQKRMTFSTFDRDRLNLPSEERDNLNRAYQVAYDYARSPEGWLVLQGVTGCGKTHLASAIVNFRFQSGMPAQFTVVPEFLDHLRSTFSPDSKVSYDKLFDRVKTVPFLVLDDFGEHACTSWALDKLYQVISYRYNAQLPTVVTTRASLDEIEPAISSRFIDHQFSMVFNITAPDYRGDAGSKANRRLNKSRPAKK